MLSLAILLFCGIILIQHSKEDSIIIESFPIDVCYNKNTIYFIGKLFNNGSVNTYNLYKVNKNNYTLEKMPFPELEEKFIFKKIATWNGDLYAVLSKIDTENQYEVWKIKDSEATFLYNLSESINFPINRIVSFCIDKNGINYFRSTSNIILFEPLSGESILFPDLNEDISFESMAVGKNGNVHALFCKNIVSGGGYEIVEFSNKKIYSIYSGNLLPYDDIYSVLGSGNKEYDLFIKGSKSVYGFNKDTQKAEYITPLSLDEYRYTKSCFIDGKTLLIWGMNPKFESKKTLNQAKLLLIDLQKREPIKCI